VVEQMRSMWVAVSVRMAVSNFFAEPEIS
jgi:hypothetical protein